MFFLRGYSSLTCHSDQSEQSDHDTRIWYHGWAASKQSLQTPPFFSLGHFQLALPADFLFRAWGPFLERPGKFSGPKANFKITVIIAQFLAHKPVNFASLNVSFLVLF